MVSDSLLVPEIMQPDYREALQQIHHLAVRTFQRERQRGHLNTFAPEDLVQQVVFDALRKGDLELLLREQSVQTRRLRCAFIDQMRRSKARPHRPLEGDVEQKEEHLLVREHVQELAERLLGRLTRDDAQLLHAYHVEEDRAEVASRFGLKRGSAYNRVAAIKKLLHEAEARAEEANDLIEAYVENLEQGLGSAGRPFLALDLTGNGHAFYNWPDNESFLRVLEVTGAYASRRRALRIFVIEPARVTEAYLRNFRYTLRTHLRHGVQVGILDGQLAPGQARDMAFFGRHAVDFGHLEYQGRSDVGLEPRYFSEKDRGFAVIETTLRQLLRRPDLRIVQRVEHIDDAIRHLARHIPTS